MQVNSEDITVPWGAAPDQLDHQYGKWRLAVFQDVQESLDSSKLYFLYDPIADDGCITTGGRKSMTCLAVFDVNRKCFVGEIPLRVQGRVKFLFALKSPSPAGGSAFALVTQSEDYGQYVMHVWRLNLGGDGMSLQGDPHSLVNSPIVIDSEFICLCREDAPELVVIFGPGMNVVRVNANAIGPQEVMDRFSVAGSELSHFYDGFVSQGNIYFLSASPDGHFDNSRVHILSLATRGNQLSTQYCQPDPQRGMPPARKQAGIDAISGFILLAGGEVDNGYGDVTRLTDYWVLDLTTFKWNQVPAEMPVPLIEPRLTTANSGNVYVWGDYDEPLPGMPAQGTHVRIFRLRGLNTLSPPPYGQSATPSYPTSGYGQPQQQYGGGGYGNGGGGGGGAQPYPTSGYGGAGGPPQYGGQQQQQYGGGGGPPAGFHGAGAGGYPMTQQNPSGGYPNTSGQQQQGGEGMYPGIQPGDYPGQTPYYPPQEKKKDCCIS